MATFSYLSAWDFGYDPEARIKPPSKTTALEATEVDMAWVAEISYNSETIDGIHFEFGKYKGCSPREIASINPGYLIWAFEDVTNKGQLCSEKLIECCRKFIEKNPTARH